MNATAVRPSNSAHAASAKWSQRRITERSVNAKRSRSTPHPDHPTSRSPRHLPPFKTPDQRQKRMFDCGRNQWVPTVTNASVSPGASTTSPPTQTAPNDGCRWRRTTRCAPCWTATSWPRATPDRPARLRPSGDIGWGAPRHRGEGADHPACRTGRWRLGHLRSKAEMAAREQPTGVNVRHCYCWRSAATRRRGSSRQGPVRQHLGSRANHMNSGNGFRFS
jgi:hypothetical protein